MPLTRRQLLKSAAASGALLVARPWAALAAGTGATRASRLDPTLHVAHADLHNHSLLSDGDGDPAEAFASMRASGLDVAALTDHAGVGKLQGSTCQGCAQAVGIDEGEWQRMGALADEANVDGAFVAVRGFEWSSPTLGHMNVWFSETWTDPLVSGAIGATTTASFLVHEGGDDVDPEVERRLNELFRTLPEGDVSMRGFYDWLANDPHSPLVGGGADGIAGFNHPGREAGRIGYFAYDPRIAERVVSLELFNRGEDYLFEGTPEVASPLVECLDAGWKVGFTGVTDEHGTTWGVPDGKGRTGLLLPAGALSRDAARAGMLSRRIYATREKGLRFDATANGTPMGGTVAHTAGPMSFAVDIDHGDAWTHLPVRIQLLQTGTPLPRVVFETDAVIPSGTEPVITFDAPIDRADGSWVVLRVTDPALPADERAPAGSAYAAAGRAIAYASPFHLAGTS